MQYEEKLRYTNYAFVNPRHPFCMPLIATVWIQNVIFSGRACKNQSLFKVFYPGVRETIFILLYSFLICIPHFLVQLKVTYIIILFSRKNNHLRGWTEVE